jgi:hypothetical protein
METKIKKYELKQHGKKYILSTQIFEDKLRFACIEMAQDQQIIYIGQFSINDLIQISPAFSTLTEISKAQELFDMLILKQKVSIENKENYLNLNIIIKRENQADEKLTIKLNLLNGAQNNTNQISTTITETNINHYNFTTTENNNLDEKLLYSPVPSNNGQENNAQYNQQIYENITTEEQNINSPIINTGIQEHQLINSQTNIISNSNDQLILSPDINKDANINIEHHEQNIQTSNDINNINYQEQQYIQTSNEINIPSSTQEISVNNNQQDIKSQNIISQNINEASSADDFIQQFLQSQGNTTSQEQYTQKTQENVNTTEQYTQDFDINKILQENNIINAGATSQTENNININQIATNNNTEGQYIEQPAQINTNITSQEQYLQQGNEITNDINTTENYYQQISSNAESQNQYIQSIQQPTTNITSNTTTTQAQYVQIPTSTITTQKQYIVQSQPTQSQTEYYNMTQNQVKKTKIKKTEKIVLSLLPQPQEEPKIEEVNYETSAQIYTQPEVQPPQIIVQDNPELENLRNENARLLEEINSLKSQMNIYINENRTLKSMTTVKTEVPNNDQEILLLREEIQKLRLELSTYSQYKIEKEDEINTLNIKIKGLLSRLKELELRNEELRAYIEKLSQMKSEGGNQVEALTIQDTRLEIIRGDIIENANELELLTRKICQNKYKKISLNLLYKAIVDSDKAEIFHKKCDSANSTLVLVKSANGKRFGGFTSCKWEGKSIEKKDEKAFIFSLDKMKIYNVIPGEDAIGCYPNFGPVFLGCQIRIYNDFFKNGGTTYEKGLNFDTQEDYELTGGLNKFGVKDIEVYSVELSQ